MTYNPQEYLNEQTKQINDIYNAQKQSKLASLQQSRAKALGEFEAKKQALEPKYNDLRNQADVTSNQNQNRMLELMASNGLSRSGENITTQANLLGQRQSTLDALNLQKQQALSEIDRNVASVNDTTEDDAINNSIEADRTNALIKLREEAEARAYQEAQAEKERVYQEAQAEKERQFQLQRDRINASDSGGTTLEQLAAIIAQQNQNQVSEPTPKEIAQYKPGTGVKSAFQINKQKKLFGY